jgi:uncharacterized protein
MSAIITIMYKRKIFDQILARISEKRKFIQILIGPRQVGKTTLIQQVLEAFKGPKHYASADEPTLRDRNWLEEQWQTARSKSREGVSALLVLDEVQKIVGWSGMVKMLWDEDMSNKTDLKVVLLGSSALLIQKGLTESLAGRFEVIHVPHWSYGEMRETFDWDVEKFIYFGGYPGAAILAKDEERWSNYINDSLIETTVSRDLLLLTRVDKPALLRQLFKLGCLYSSRIISYQKLLGQLQDAGNTTTLAHYLNLLTGAGLLTGIQKIFIRPIHQKASSPKLQVLNTALVSSQANFSFSSARNNGEFWGFLTESAIGAHLLNSSRGTKIEVLYWRDRNREVDFILRLGDKITAIEVKSGRKKESLPGVQAFGDLFRKSKKILVGEQGIKIQEFLSKPACDWIF